MKKIRLFSPATVANVSCGFDALGFALDAIGDEMVLYKTKNAKVVNITAIEGANLPFESNKNVVGVVGNLMLKDCNANFGIDVEIYKKYKPGSGLGSSAASAAGIAVGINHFLKHQYSNLELTQFAMQGELAACGTAIADNVASAIYGGFILVRSYNPLDIISLPTPKDLMATVIHPQIEIRTEEARKILPKEISIDTATTQWANLGGLVSGLYESNYETISKALVDVVAEPYRKTLIPNFKDVKRNAILAGALGFGISGSGPSMFALSKGEKTAKKVAEAMKNAYNGQHIDFNIYISKIGVQGVKIL